MNRYADGAPQPPVAFAVTATVTHVEQRFFIIEDEHGSIPVFNPGKPNITPGDTVAMSGRMAFCPVGNASTSADSEISVIGHTAPAPVLRINIAELDSQKHSNRRIETEGVVIDVFRDEIDSRTVFLILRDGNAKYPVATRPGKGFTAERFLEARIKVRGVFMRRPSAYRLLPGPSIIATEEPEILSPPPQDPFEAPELRHYPAMIPQEVYSLPRRTVTGHVLAAWNGNEFLLRTLEHKFVSVQTLDNTPLPRIGEGVKVVGFPTTDLFRIKLTRAVHRTEADMPPFTPDTPTEVLPEDLMSDNAGLQPKAVRFTHGRTIRYRGKVQRVPGRPATSSRIPLLSGSVLITLDAGTSGMDIGRIPPDTEIEVCGICIYESENWTPENIFPHIRGMTLVMRTEDDLSIVKSPPWWTIRRLSMVVAVLFSGLLAFLLWNRRLNRLAVRRGHALAREKTKREAALLKTEERTRLAVELHDSLSQNLEGIACLIAAVRTVITTSQEEAVKCLGTAERMLDSCRLELRRCLFDLRGRALEEKDFASAIRITLGTLCENATVSVNFDVRRKHFDDSSAHAVLCTIRELVANAIRHGKADDVSVTGEMHDGLLSFSVHDNGSGFDPATSPGPAEGHFGLEGIRERAERFDGSVTISSEPGHGSSITVTLRLAQKCAAFKS